MRIFNRNPLSDAAWEMTKNQFPEWAAPETSDEGLSHEEIAEDFNYIESKNE